MSGGAKQFRCGFSLWLSYSSVQWIERERGNAAITAAAGAQTMAGPPPLTRLVGRQQGRKRPEFSGKRGK